MCVCHDGAVSGTDEAAVINLLTKRTNAQRQEIMVKFKLMYGKVGPARSCCVVWRVKELMCCNMSGGDVVLYREWVKGVC